MSIGVEKNIYGAGGVGQVPSKSDRSTTSSEDVGGQIDSIIDSLLSLLSDKFDLEVAQDAGHGAIAQGAGGRGAGGASAGFSGGGGSGGGGGQQGQNDYDGTAGVDSSASGAVNGAQDGQQGQDADGEDGEGLDGKMEMLLKMLMGVLGRDDLASPQEKGKIMEFIRDLKALVDKDGRPETQSDLNRILQDGYEFLGNGSDVSANDFSEMSTIVFGNDSGNRGEASPAEALFN